MILYEKQLDEKFDPTSEEIKLASTEDDKKSYGQALAYIDKGDFDKAYKILTPLFPEYEKTSFGDCIKLRMALCLFRSSDNQLRLLSEIVDGDTYSPVLAEAFHRWRTEYQAMDSAMMEKMRALTSPGEAHKVLESFVGKWDYKSEII